MKAENTSNAINLRINDCDLWIWDDDLREDYGEEEGEETKDETRTLGPASPSSSLILFF